MKDVLGLSLESWAWRAVMPALILGGNVAGFTLFVVAVLRITTWWREHRRARWEWRLGSLWWVAYFGLQLLGGLWSSDLDAWRLSLEVKSSLWFLPVLLAMPGRQVARDFWWSLGWSVTVYLSWRMLRAGWHQVVLDVPTEWRYARFSGDVHPTYMSLHLGAAFLGLGTQWARTLKPVMVWVCHGAFCTVFGHARLQSRHHCRIGRRCDSDVHDVAILGQTAAGSIVEFFAKRSGQMVCLHRTRFGFILGHVWKEVC